MNPNAINFVSVFRGYRRSNVFLTLCFAILCFFGFLSGLQNVRAEAPLHAPYSAALLPMADCDTYVKNGATLVAGCIYTIPQDAGKSTSFSFCLPDAGTARVIIANDVLALTSLRTNTCFEVIFGIENEYRTERGLLLDHGEARIEINNSPSATLLVARNGDLVTAASTGISIRASVDAVCTDTRVVVESGTVDAPAWIVSPRPSVGCAADALTPPRSSYAVGDGTLACPATLLEIDGIYSALSLTGTLALASGQQVFLLARVPGSPDAWFQLNPNRAWLPFDGQFTPFYSAAGDGQIKLPFLSRLSVLGLPRDTELYLGIGSTVDDMVMNRRYCGFFTLGL